MSDSLWPHGPQPARLLCPWDSPGKNTGSRWPCPPPGDLYHPGIKLRFLTSPALAGGFFTTSTTWEAYPSVSQWAFFQAGSVSMTYHHHFVFSCWLKKMHNLRAASQVLFRARWELPAEGSSSQSSERLLQRGSGGRPIYKVKWEFNTIEHSFYKRFSASHRDLMSSVKWFSAFLDMRRYKDWDHKISSSKYPTI